MVAAFWLAGCADEQKPTASTASSTPAAVGASTVQAALPAPETLAGVMSTLADISVPGEQKVGAVQYATPEDETALTKFAQALKDSGFDPVTVTAADLAWSTTPGNVTADITIAAGNPAVKPFTYPMEFSPLRDAWQLTQKSADQLLPLGGA